MKFVVILLKKRNKKKTYEGVHQEEFSNKAEAFWEHLLICFVWVYNTSISLGIVKDLSDCLRRFSLFLLYLHFRKSKIRTTKATSNKEQRRNNYPKYFFYWILLSPGTNDPPTNRPPTTYAPIHWPPSQRLAESIIIFERLDNKTSKTNSEK